MVKIELDVTTLSVLIAGLYCTAHDVSAIAIPESVYLTVAEQLSYFIDNDLWDFNKISFEEWVSNCLLIYPKAMFTEEELKELQEIVFYWEVPVGNAVLVVSMDVGEING